MRHFDLGLRRVQTVLTVCALVAIGLVGPATNAQADTSPPAGEPATYGGDALPTVQQSGVAWTQVIIGSSGDGAAATGATANRTYAAAGTFPIQLTVTEDRGVAASTSHSVVVQVSPATQPVQPGQSGSGASGQKPVKALLERIYKTKIIKVAKSKTTRFKIGSFITKYDVSKFRLRAVISTGGQQGKVQLRLPQHKWHTWKVREVKTNQATVKLTVTKDGRLEVWNHSNRTLKIRLVIDKIWINGTSLPLTLF